MIRHVNFHNVVGTTLINWKPSEKKIFTVPWERGNSAFRLPFNWCCNINSSLGLLHLVSLPLRFQIHQPYNYIKKSFKINSLFLDRYGYLYLYIYHIIYIYLYLYIFLPPPPHFLLLYLYNGAILDYSSFIFISSFLHDKFKTIFESQI